jgi:molecular chaperone DnaK
VVAFLPNDTVQVGESARRRRCIDSQNTIFSSKRIIGRRFDDGYTRNFMDRYPFEIVEGPDGSPAFRTRAGDITPTDVARRVLVELMRRAGVAPGACDIALTVPASFTAPARAATVEAAAAAGIVDPSVVPEPCAVARAYLDTNHPCQRAVVYDLGGGTFDCAVLDCSGDVPRILSHVSDLHLGGDDIDHELATWVARVVLEKHNWDLTSYSETWNRLLLRCEHAKIDLCVQERAPIQLSQVDPECPVGDDAIVVTQQLLDEICEGLVRRTFMACDDVLRQAGLRPPDIDAVFLAGGTTMLPTVQRGVETYFGRAGFSEFDPTAVVAIGAAIAVGD